MAFETRVKHAARRVVPRALLPYARKIAKVLSPSASTQAAGNYAANYEAVARSFDPKLSIGGGDYDEMGAIMMSALVDAGLTPQSTLVDFGCGTGRLLPHALSFLQGGRYVGTDIAPTMLTHARALAASLPPSDTPVEFQVQTGPTFALADQSIDVFAAFSVFTHMEHEDAYRYLLDARRAIRDNGRFVLSVLTMDLADARTVFLQSADIALDARWSGVRNVTTTYDYFNAVATLAGWHVRRWLPGNRALVPMLGNPSERRSIGQSICVLEPTAPLA